MPLKKALRVVPSYSWWSWLCCIFHKNKKTKKKREKKIEVLLHKLGYGSDAKMRSWLNLYMHPFPFIKLCLSPNFLVKNEFKGLLDAHIPPGDDWDEKLK